MPRNGSGVYSLPQPPFVAGTVISSAAVNSDFSDIATALTGSLPRDGQAGMLGILKLVDGTNLAPSVAFTSELTLGFYHSAAALMGLVGSLDISGNYSIGGTNILPITTANITNAAVTYAKIQNVATVSLLGNATGSPASIEEITLGSGLSFVGTVLTPTISPVLVPNYLSGLTLSTAGGSTSASIAAGVANDTGNTILMDLTSSITKTTASWAVGTNQGGLDAGTIAASTWYHVYLIERPDTGVVDVLYSLQPTAVSPTTPALPTNYTKYRRIGAMFTDGSSHWTKFTQLSDTFIFAASVHDMNNVTSTAARVNTALTLPPGISVNALFNASSNMGTGTGTLFTSLAAQNDQAPITGVFADLDGVSTHAAGDFQRYTNTSAQIGVRSDNTGATINLFTYGWVDTRGK